ncbi:MAG: hypothetical protein EPO52_03260 [Herbiconiux sp.]|uniref:hypothetical protein n=1 Tax=Herbiconiux sp. TaxID=1871186 RepID=UPI0012056434|nr:hypothetical protein [Herbiconiux sp.]TAJ49306.1 MAG: hypothetical protein EPO52_03260 [Herbiconiux sp.]
MGVTALVWIPRAQRTQLVPAIPVIGAAGLVVLLHVTGLVLPVRVGIWIIVAACLVLLVVAAVVGRFRSFVSGRSLIHLVLVLATGAIGAVVALWPSLAARSPLAAQPSPNNDAFYYVGSADWFSEHSVLQSPSIGQGPSSGLDSPAFGPAAESIRLGLRVGQDMLHAGVSDVLFRDPVATFTPLIAVYVLLIPGSAWVLGSAFRITAAARVLLGAALVTTFTLVNQVQNQNAASILGIAMVPLVIGVVAMRTRRRSDDIEDTRVPLWVAAIAVSALVGTYTEYAVFAGAVIAGVVLVGPIRSLATRLKRAAAVLAVAVAVGPLIWVRAIYGITITFQMTASNGKGGSDLLSVLGVFASPYVALLSAQPPTVVGELSRVAVIACGVAAGLGLLFALVFTCSRGLAVGIVIAIVGAAYIGTRGNDYVTGRASDMVTPLIICAAVIGWAALVERLQGAGPSGGAVKRVTGAGLVAVAAGVVGLSALGAWNFVVVNGPDDRFVTNDFSDAAGWVKGVQEAGGADITVATASLFDQLWISESLRSLPDVSYISLRGDLGYRSDLAMTSFWEGERDRYVLVGPGGYFDGDADVIERNSTFALLDFDNPAVVATPVVDVPGSATWGYGVDPAGVIRSGGHGPAPVDLLTNRASLEGSSLLVSVDGVPTGSEIAVVQDGLVVDTEVASGGVVALDLSGVAVNGSTARVSIEVVGQPEQIIGLVGIGG